LTPFARDYFGAYHYRSDFRWDGAINLWDLSLMAGAIAAQCLSAPRQPAADLPVVGQAALSFALDSVRTSRRATPGELIQAYLLVAGPVTEQGLGGLQGRLRTTDNLEVVQWSFAGRQINVAAPPEFMVAWGEPQTAKAAGEPVCVLTVTLRVVDDQPARLVLDGSSAGCVDHGQLDCTLGAEAALGRLVVANIALAMNDPTVSSATDLDPLVAGSLRNTPNPFNPSTDIAFVLARGGEVEVRIFDVTGRLVHRVAGGSCGPGPGSVHWDGRGQQGAAAPSGLYFGQVLIDGTQVGQTLKMNLVR
jgi:hypothetical protein